MTKAKWNGGLWYEDSTGKTYQVKNEADLDARLVQDIIACSLRGEVPETEGWLLRYVERHEPDFRADIEASVERVRRYLDPHSNFLAVLWRADVIPPELAAKVMGFLAKEYITIGRPALAPEMIP